MPAAPCTQCHRGIPGPTHSLFCATLTARSSKRPLVGSVMMHCIFCALLSSGSPLVGACVGCTYCRLAAFNSAHPCFTVHVQIWPPSRRKPECVQDSTSLFVHLCLVHLQGARQALLSCQYERMSSRSVVQIVGVVMAVWLTSFLLHPRCISWLWVCLGRAALHMLAWVSLDAAGYSVETQYHSLTRPLVFLMDQSHDLVSF